MRAVESCTGTSSQNLLISTASHDIKLLDFSCGDLLKGSVQILCIITEHTSDDQPKGNLFALAGTFSVDVSGLLGSLASTPLLSGFVSTAIIQDRLLFGEERTMD